MGDRLPTNAEYQRSLGVGSGTVQNSLLYLTEAGAARVLANGRRGTFLADKNVGRLWDLADLGPVMGVVPLLVSGEWAGLATGLRSEFERVKVPLQTLHVHGSYRRMEMVAEGKADFAALSREAADRIASAQCDDDFVSWDLGPCTYYGPDSLIVMYRPGLEDAAGSQQTEHPSVHRVGIDRTAYDHTRLTQSEFPEREGYTHVDARYPYMPAAIVNGNLDAAVWNRQMLLLPLESVGIPVRPLRQPESIAASQSMSNAALVHSCVQQKGLEIAAVLEQIDRKEVSRIQDSVRAEETMPTY